MLIKWIKSDVPGRTHKIAINSLGAIMTLVAVFSIAYSKMLQGVWIAILLMIVIMFLMKMTSIHYKDVARQLKLNPEQVLEESSLIQVKKHTIVIIGSVNKASLKVITYARQLSDDKNIVVFHVSIDEEHSKQISEQWQKCNIPDVLDEK
jgi:alcohol dehydrogenase class IV